METRAMEQEQKVEIQEPEKKVEQKSEETIDQEKLEIEE